MQRNGECLATESHLRMHSSWFGIQFLEDKDDADNAETKVQSPNGRPPTLHRHHTASLCDNRHRKLQVRWSCKIFIGLLLTIHFQDTSLRTFAESSLRLPVVKPSPIT